MSRGKHESSAVSVLQADGTSAMPRAAVIPERSSQHSSIDSQECAVISRPGLVVYERTVVRKPLSHEILVRIEGCGVCGSNIPVWQGRPWFEYPLPAGAPGHEGWGEVIATGSEVSEFVEGDRVAMLSNNAFAQFDVVNQEQAILLPQSLKEVDVPAEPMACACNVFNRSDIRPGQWVVIIGIGYLGALLTQLCATAGAKVIAISRREYARKVAMDCGAVASLQVAEPWELSRSIKDLTGFEGISRVVEATGEQKPLELAGELVGVRGRLIIAGYHQDGLRQVNLQNWNWKGIDVINAHEREPQTYVKGMREAVKAIEEGRLRPSMLHTHTFQLSELAIALDMTLQRPDGFLKAIVKPQL